MYPQFERIAKAEQNIEAVKEFNEQGRESNEHAQAFKAILEKAEKRFTALKKVEERHANAYKQVLEAL
jgi:rubrerythrin